MFIRLELPNKLGVSPHPESTSQRHRSQILKNVSEEEQMPEEWKKGEIVPIHKQKGDPLECGNVRGIKLLEHDEDV